MTSTKVEGAKEELPDTERNVSELTEGGMNGGRERQRTITNPGCENLT